MIVRRGIIELFEGGRREIGCDTGTFRVGHRERATLPDLLEFAHHLAAHLFGAQRVDEDLDAGLVEIVPASRLIVDAHHRFEKCQDVRLLDKITHHMADIGRASHAAAGIDAIADTALRIADDLDADIVELDGRAVMLRTRHRDLELARQEREFRMQARPLPDDFRQHPRVLDLVARGAREMVRRHIADAVAARLDRVHFDGGEIGERFGHVDEPDPVELDVLPRGEMTIALVIFAGDMGQHPELSR
jgi:hypothetical protein